MWNLLQSIQEQVTKYSTWLGQLWYLFVFVFRLIVVVTIGGAVYGDEQSEFECNNKEPGCENMCFNASNRISHIRFWAFQLLAVATPTVLFHFYSMGVTGQIEKNKLEQKEINERIVKIEEGQSEYSDTVQAEKQHHKLEKRKKKIGNVRFKKVYSGGELTEVPYTTKIHIAYFISVILRMALEGVFMYLAYEVFTAVSRESSKIPNFVPSENFIWFSMPELYMCTKDDPAVETACHQSVFNGGKVTCWIPRPWEKTILIRYMNILSVACLILCMAESVYLAVKAVLWYNHRSERIMTQQGILRSREAPLYGSHAYSTMTSVTPPGGYYPTLPPMINQPIPRYEYANSSAMSERMVPMRVVNNDAMSVVTDPLGEIPIMRPLNGGGSTMLTSRMNINNSSSSNMRPSEASFVTNAHIHHD